MKLNKLTTAIFGTLASLCMAGSVHAANVLVTQYDYETSKYDQMAATLTAAGNTVDVVDAKVAGNLASALGSKSYDQVYLWDLTGSSYLGGSDLTALSSFWSGHKGLVVDSRSYGYYYQGDNASEMALLQNVSNNFKLTGGGVWVGTDHNPDWTNNGNAFLSEIGVNTVTGNYSDAVNYADPSSVLLAGGTPTALWGGGQSIGKAPLGLQPNGITMYLHYGHIATSGAVLPYISASFPLAGPVPEPETYAMLLAGLGVMGAVARRRKANKQA